MTEDLLKSINEYLNQQGYDSVIHKQSIKVNTIIERRIFTLKCVFSSSFPYEFPRIYLRKDQYKEVYPLPHIDDDCYICTFDTNTSIPNFKNAERLVFEIIQQAIKIIEDGLQKGNTEDFKDEFQAYWSLEASASIESIYQPGDIHEIIDAYYHKDHEKYYVAKNRNQLDEYLNNIGILVHKVNDYRKCLYLPLQSIMIPPFPNTNLEMYSYVKNNSVHFNAYKTFLTQNIGKMVMVLFSQKINNSYNLQAWIHPYLGRTLNISRGKAKIPGFRNTSITPGVLFQTSEGKDKILKIRVNNMSQSRLFTRGGEGQVDVIKSAAIIGCGSVGGYLSESLSMIGVSSFLLLDNDNLSSDNIARHLCGYNFIGKKKINGIKTLLVNHNPNINCQCYDTNAFDFLQNNCKSFNRYDFVFINVGYAPLEFMFCQKFNENDIDSPLVLLWVEPFLVGGHAIILQKKQDIFDMLFDDEFNFKFNIVKDSGNFTRREAGCQSSYIPYSGFEVRQFVNAIVAYIQDKLLPKKLKGNYLITYIGNKDKIKYHNIQINGNWKDCINYSLNVKRID